MYLFKTKRYIIPVRKEGGSVGKCVSKEAWMGKVREKGNSKRIGQKIPIRKEGESVRII